jgi:hypothetical protein
MKGRALRSTPRRCRSNRCRRARGAAVITVLAALVAVTAVGVAVAGHTVRSLADARLDVHRTAARLGAEGAVEVARAALARDPAWTGVHLDVGTAATIVDVTPGPSPAARCVVARARVAPPGDRGPAAQVVVEATVVLGDGLPRITSWRER